VCANSATMVCTSDAECPNRVRIVCVNSETMVCTSVGRTLFHVFQTDAREPTARHARARPRARLTRGRRGTTRE
jgi:hypothetical protein